MTKRFWVTAVLLLAVQPGIISSQRPTGNETANWIERLATVYYERRPSAEVRKERFNNTDAIIPLLNDLREVLSESQNEQLSMSGSVDVVTGYRPIWKGNAFLQPEWDRRLARLKQLPDDAIERWQMALTAIAGKDVPLVWTMVLVSDVADIFPSEKFDTTKASALLARAGQLPGDAIKSLSALLNMDSSDGAILVVQNNDFFDSVAFRSETFNGAVERLRTRLQTPGR